MLNISLYYILWWATVLLTTSQTLSLLPVILLITLTIHFIKVSKDKKRDIHALVITVILGLALDGSLHFTHFFTLNYNFYLWLPVIWLGFATTVYYSLRKIFNKTIPLCIFSFFGGPLSYYSASKFKMITYSTNLYSLIFHGLMWILFILLLRFFLEKYCEKF